MPPSHCPVRGLAVLVESSELGFASVLNVVGVPVAHKLSPYGHLLLLVKVCCAGRV